MTERAEDTTTSEHDHPELHQARQDLARAERLAAHQAAVLEGIARGDPLPVVAEACVLLVEANGVGGSSSVYLLEGSSLALLAGRAPEAVNRWVREPIRGRERSLCDSALLDGTAITASDLSQPAVPVPLQQLAEAAGIRAAWSQPIMSISTGRPVGTLSTLYRTCHEPSAHERRVGDAACSLMAIALERAESEARLAHQALHDPLTRLPNRTLFLDRLDQALARRVRQAAEVAVLFCDIDRFKVVNDSLGHGVGDEILVAFAARFREGVDERHTVARFGGDEFVILLEDVVDEAQPVQVARDLAAVLEAPFVLAAGQEVYLTASIGIAFAHDDRAGDAWLRDADAAMYRAKAEGRNRHVLFDREMRRAAVERLEIENDLRRAVAHDELVVHFQAIVDLRTGRITGAEALARWLHPVRGLLPPAEFIGVAEDTGAIDGIGRRVLSLAVEALSDLARVRPDHPLRLSVNVSGHQLVMPGFADVVQSVCARHGWPPSSLLLEITESALPADSDESVEQLRRLAAIGIHLALDDFGTGYSSLARLAHVPVGELKIDRSFVATIDHPGAPGAGIVDAVTALAHALGLHTTAEGVESSAQLDHLRRIGCTNGQGYFFSKPVPIDEFRALVEADPTW